MRLTRGTCIYRILSLLFVGVVVRFLLDVLFFALYGPHAVGSVEFWLYYGVASGSHLTAGGAGDPTVWLLRAFGFLFSGDALFYSIVILAAFLSAAAAALVYLVAREFFDDEAAYYGGLIYALMVEPLALSVVVFTHDLLLVPVMLSVVLFSVRAFRSAGWLRIWYAALAVLFLFLAVRVNIGAYVSAGVVGVYLASEHMGRFRKYYPYFAAAVVFSILLVGLCVIPAVMDYELGKLPQGRLGSADVRPISLSNFWMRYNVLLMLIPFGVYVAYRRRETISITYLLVGFVFAATMDRGTRLSDIGVAMLAGYALAYWSCKWVKPLVYGGSSIVLAASFLVPLPFEARLMVAAAGAALLYCMRSSPVNVKGALAVLFSLSVLLVVADLASDTGKVVSETEYRLYADTLSGLGGGRVLTAWDRGYVLEALSGKSALSTAGSIEYAAHEALWQPERQAYEALNRMGADYVVFSDSYYNHVIYGGEPYYLLEGGQVMTPKDLPPMVVSEYLAVYKLRFREADPEYFQLVSEVEDSVLNRTYVVYRVVKSGENRTLMSLVALSHERQPLAATVNLTVAEYANGKTPYYISIVSPFEDVRPLLASLAVNTLRLFVVGLLAALAHLLYAIPKLRGRRLKASMRKAACAVSALVVCVVLLYAGVGEVAAPEAAEPPEPVNLTYKTFSVTFPPNMSAAYLDVGGVGDVYNCSVSVPGGFGGSVTFRNGCGIIDEKARIMLVDATISNRTGQAAVEDYVELGLKMRLGEEKTVNYTFTRLYPYHDYVVAYWKPGCVVVDAGKSSEPAPSGIEAVHMFCGRATDVRDYEKIT
jgi:hypothetical protein